MLRCNTGRRKSGPLKPSFDLMDSGRFYPIKRILSTCRAHIMSFNVDFVEDIRLAMP